MFNWLKRTKSREREIEDELNYHLAMLAREHLEEGETMNEAKFSAQRELGNRTLIKELLRDMWDGTWFEDFCKDIRVTHRQLRKAPGFTAAAVLSLALGIGANTAIFALAEIDPRLPVLRVTTLADHVSSMLNQENVIAVLAMFFGFVALVLSCLGLYGLMAYSVERRTSEIGIRIALGAGRSTVTGMVIREALVQGFIGILVGVPAAFAALQIVASQLYGVSPDDPRYSAAAALVLLVCIAIAGYLPARRASRVDPLVALRYE